MRSRKFLALIFSLLAIAPALAGYMTLLGAGVGSIQPAASWVSTTDPTFPSSSLSHSRTSLATMFDSTGKLTYAPNNLLLMSNTFSNAAWTKTNTTVSNANSVSDPFGGTTASTVTATAPGGGIYAPVTSNTSTTYLASFWVRRRTGSGTISIQPPVGTGSVAISVTGSWQQFYVTGPGGASQAFASIVIATSGDAIDVYAATLSAVTYETTPRTADQVITTASAYYGPRIDYDPNTLAVKGLLIEEARTNQNKSSADIAGTGWTAGANVTIGATTTAPDGTSSAKLYQSTGASDGLYNTSAVAIASPFASSVYLKYGGSGRWFVIRSYGTGGAQLWVDLLNGVIGTSSNYSGIGTVTTPTITAINNGWYRLTLGTSSGATHNYLQINSVNADNSTVQANGTAYVWGAQTEAGSFATSYIPTVAASVTRAADVVQFTGAAAAVLPTSAGTIITEVGGITLPISSNVVVVGNAGSYASFINSNGGGVTKNGVSGFRFASNALESASNFTNGASANRFGVAWGPTTFSLSGNGAAVTTGSGTTAFSGTPYLGSANTGSTWINGWVRSFAIYNQRLPDATLQAKSVVGASYAANDNGVRFAFANDNLPVHWRIAL